MKPRASIVVPVYQEGARIERTLDHLLGAISLPCEILVVFDSHEDSTVPHLARYAERDPRVIPTLNTYGRGPAHAIRFGFDRANAQAVVVTMADGSDDVTQIDEMVGLVEEGAAIVAPSRYSPGGKQVGGPPLKRFLSRAAGFSLNRLAGVATRDPTNSFKAYSRSFLRSVRVESGAGFEVALELVAKATRLGLPVVEIPTVWRDRAEGSSNFKLFRWLPKYLRWFLFAFGAKKGFRRADGQTSERN